MKVKLGNLWFARDAIVFTGFGPEAENVWKASGLSITAADGLPSEFRKEGSLMDSFPVLTIFSKLSALVYLAAAALAITYVPDRNFGFTFWWAIVDAALGFWLTCRFADRLGKLYGDRETVEEEKEKWD